MQSKSIFVVRKDSPIHPANTVAPLKIWYKKQNAIEWVVKFILAYDERLKGLQHEIMLKEAEKYIEEVMPMDDAD